MFRTFMMLTLLFVAVSCSDNGSAGVRNLYISEYVPAVADAGTDYSQAFTVSGGRTPYTFSLENPSALPGGLSLDASLGIISGTVDLNASGPYGLGLLVSDSDNRNVSRNYILYVNPVSGNGALTILNEDLPGAVSGSAYSFALSAAGGQGGYAWSVASGNASLIPSGLDVSASGLLSGTPVLSGGPGAFSFYVTCEDNAGGFGEKELSLVVTAGSVATLKLKTSSLPAGYVNSYYDETVTVSGGRTPYDVFVADVTARPAWLAVDGLNFTGTPDCSGSYEMLIMVTDADGRGISRSFTITVRDAVDVLRILTEDADLPLFSTTTPVDFQFQASGGEPTYEWYHVSGYLPDGLTLDPDGRLWGTPTVSGSYFPVFEVRDSVGRTDAKEYFIYVSD